MQQYNDCLSSMRDVKEKINEIYHGLYKLDAIERIIFSVIQYDREYPPNPCITCDPDELVSIVLSIYETIKGETK